MGSQTHETQDETACMTGIIDLQHTRKMYMIYQDTVQYPDPFLNRMHVQLCLPLTEVPYKLNNKQIRPVPEIAKELFELSDDSPSGLVWRVRPRNGRGDVGKPAGTRMTGRNRDRFFVHIAGHGNFYAHRVVYFLKYGQNPGSMVVRHVGDDEMVLGWQPDNGRDEKNVVGKRTSKLYSYKGEIYNLRSLCLHLGLDYSTMYQRRHRCRQDTEKMFADTGVAGVIALFDPD